MSFEIENIYKVNDFDREYIAKVIAIDNNSLISNIKAIISIPFNFKPKK